MLGTADSHARVLELEDQLSAMRHDKQMLELRLDRIHRANEAERKAAEQRYKEDLVRVRKEARDLPPEELKMLDALKQQLGDLLVAEPTYWEMKKIPPENQTVKEYVLTKVYEFRSHDQASINELRTENKELRDELTHSNKELDSAQLKLERIQRESLKMQTELSERVRVAEEANHALVHQQKSDMLLLQDLKPQAESMDKARHQIKKLEAELKQRISESALQAKSIVALTHERDLLASQAAEAQQSHSLLKMDKDYLLRDVQALTDRVQRMQTTNEQLERKADDLKHKKNKLRDEVETLRHKQAYGFDERIDKELALLRERSAHELEEVRRTNRDAFERENNVLREARDQFKFEAEKNHQLYIQCRRQLEDVQREHRQLSDSLESQTSELRNGLNLKCFELERLTVSREEAAALAKQSKLEAEMLHCKVELLKQEYYELQASSAKVTSALEARVGAMSEKLALYEKIEDDLDKAICEAGSTADDHTAERVVSSISGSAALSMQRRVAHSLHLARKVLEQQREQEETAKELHACRTALKQLEAQVRAAKEQQELLAQPQVEWVRG
jgi:chromosome segregation ATPase